MGILEHIGSIVDRVLSWPSVFFFAVLSPTESVASVVASVATIVAALATSAATIIAAVALVCSRNIAKQNKHLNFGNNLLQIKDAFWEKDRHKVHRRIMREKNEDFFSGKKYKDTNDEALYVQNDFVDECMVNEYMGLFEVVYILYKNGGLHKNHIISIYKYRIKKMMENERIVWKLVDESDDWQNFYDLATIVTGKEWNKFYDALQSIEHQSNDKEKNDVKNKKLQELEKIIDGNLYEKVVAHVNSLDSQSISSADARIKQSQ